MISQRCPRCLSKRIRRGYRQTPILSKLFFRYHLLCDSCNWEFKGFAVPGTVSTKTKKRGKKVEGNFGPKEKVKSEETNSQLWEEKKDLEKKFLEFEKKIKKDQLKKGEKKQKLEEKFLEFEEKIKQKK